VTGTPLPERPLTFGGYLGYGLGDFASNLVWGTCMAYSVYFYTDVCRIPVGIVAALMLIARILNAAVDPFVGLWMDGRPSGERARPFLKWGAVPLGLTLALSFVPVDADLVVKSVWAGATYLTLNIVYSVVNIPYGVLINLMTSDSRSRVLLSTSRFLGSSVAVILVGFATIDAAGFLGGDVASRGFARYGIVLGALTTVMILASYALTSEQLRYPASRPSLRRFVSATFGNRDWVALTISMTLSFVAATVIFGMATYYAVQNLREGAAFGGRILGVMTITSLLGIALAPALTARFGQRGICIWSNVALAAIMIAVSAVPLTAIGMLVLAGLVGFLVGAREPAIYALLANAIDPDEVTGRNAMGVAYSLNSAFCKAAVGLGSAIIAGILAVGGYLPGVAAQSSDAVQAIRMGFGYVPAVLYILSALALTMINRPPVDEPEVTPASG
jgi:sugar (glycoside-pentoside-hexuronide) transporter